MSDLESTPKHARWVNEIMLYDKEYEKWVQRGKKIVKRYKDERSIKETDDGRRRYNILYSNIQTLLPAYFSRAPKPDIQRRFKDHDDLGRITAEVWERSVSYFVETDKFRHAVKQAVVDRLLPGRGVVWVRYVPHMRDITVMGNEEVKQEGAQETEDVYAEPTQEVHFEEACFDYVYWEDFGHTIARNWEEVRAIWRKAYLTRDELIERFGEEIGSKIPLDYSPRGLSDEKITDDLKKATIYEIWDKPSAQALWLHKDYPDLLDEREDPLGLEGFFPCPGPLYPTLTNDTLIPVPDFGQYQDQAKELDDLTARIASITKAVKVAGVYDASAQGVERLLSEGTENKLIAVEQWAIFGEKGGLKGVMDLLPIEEILRTLLGLYEAREKVKQDLYEITGIADIIRGATKASETATAQTIKGQYAALRLDDGQQAVQRFARTLVRIAAQIIANHFSLETIKAISGMDLFTAQEKQQLMMQQQQAQMMFQQAQAAGKQMPPPPEPDDATQEKLINPTWEDVYALLKDNALRSFRIDIETDSTIKADQEAEKQAKVEFLTAAATFIAQTAPIAQQQPELAPLFMEMLIFGVRGFTVGKQLEAAFELTQKKMQKIADQAKDAPPKPDPEMVKAQGQVELQKQDQAHKQNQEMVEQQSEAQESQREHQREIEKIKADANTQALKEQHAADLKKAEMDYADRLERDRMNKQFMLDEKIEMLRLAMQSNDNDTKDSTKEVMAPLKEMLKAMTAPKMITLDNGRTATVKPKAS